MFCDPVAHFDPEQEKIHKKKIPLNNGSAA